MVINVSVQCNGGLLPDIILLTLQYVILLGNPFNTIVVDSHIQRIVLALQLKKLR